MKSLITAVVATIIAPIVLIGALMTAVASTDAPGGRPSSGTPTAAATPFVGPNGYVDDPTSRGRITRRMLHTYNEIQRVFEAWPWGVHCWDPHTWNPTSEHPRGRACDFTVGTMGRFPDKQDRTIGWQLAHWLQTNAKPLGITYVIWDGHIWSPIRAREGWRLYNGAGIYNPGTPTGGHHDHLHASVHV